MIEVRINNKQGCILIGGVEFTKAEIRNVIAETQEGWQTDKHTMFYIHSSHRETARVNGQILQFIKILDCLTSSMDWGFECSKIELQVHDEQ